MNELGGSGAGIEAAGPDRPGEPAGEVAAASAPDPAAGGDAIIDSHAHIWPAGLIHPAQSTARPLPSEPADLLAAAGPAGIVLTFLVPASIRPHNEDVVRAVGLAPGRLGVIAMVDPTDPAQLDQLETLTRAGAVAARVRPSAVPADGRLDPGALAALADAAFDLGLTVQWTVPLGATAAIELAAARRPGLRQVLDHLGLPPDATHLGALARMRDLAAVTGLHVKLSGLYHLSREGYPYRDTWAWAEGVVAAFGPGRTIWGSDWPLSTESASLADQVALLGRLPFLDAAARAEVGSGAARRLWDLPAA